MEAKSAMQVNVPRSPLLERQRRGDATRGFLGVQPTSSYHDLASCLRQARTRKQPHLPNSTRNIADLDDRDRAALLDLDLGTGFLELLCDLIGLGLVDADLDILR